MKPSEQSKTPKKVDFSWSPVEMATHLSHLPGLVFFDSAGNLPVNYGKAFSIVSALPEKEYWGQASDWKNLEFIWEKYRFDAPDYGFPLGGLCGYMEYEGAWRFGVYPNMLVYVHDDQQWFEIGDLSKYLRSPNPARSFTKGQFQSNFTESSFVEAVSKAKRYITAGDIYQVNLAQRYQTEIEGGSLWPLYEHLREASPAPLAGWMQLGGKEILCSSPETYLRISGSKIETRPIKGTRPRSEDPEEDRRNAYELMTSEKEIAELVMITDLERNDLGKICEFGSVRVDEMLQLETLEHVYHLVSTVRGTLRSDVNPVAAMRDCFPGGSITGAPKKRAMEIIEELEQMPRGLYTGAFGYFGFNAESQFNIPIRTLVRENNKLSYHVGAGIVADSDPLAEYQETEQKAKGMRLAIRRFLNQE